MLRLSSRLCEYGAFQCVRLVTTIVLVKCCPFKNRSKGLGDIQNSLVIDGAHLLVVMTGNQPSGWAKRPHSLAVVI
jgi:hypothetical protein